MSVFSRIQRLATGVLLLILFFAAGLFALPYLVPEREIRTALTHALVAATGTEPRIEGEARFTFLPRPAIRLDGVRFGGAESSGFSAGSLQATIRLLPLLFGRVEIASLVFERPRLLVEIGNDGAKLVGLPLRLPDNSAETRAARHQDRGRYRGIARRRRTEAKAYRRSNGRSPGTARISPPRARSNGGTYRSPRPC